MFETSYDDTSQETYVHALVHLTVKAAGTIWINKCEALSDTNGYPNARQKEEEPLPRNDNSQRVVRAFLNIAVNTKPDFWTD